MSKETGSALTVSSSVGNFFDTSTLYTLAWPVEKFATTAERSGYSGLEWHPLRLLSGLQIKSGLLTRQGRDAITSGHQSFRSEKSLREAWNHPNRLLAVASYGVLPERVKSLDDLEQLQKAVGKRLSMVLYPEYEGEESGTDRPFAQKTFQPTPEVMQRWDVNTPEELIREMYRRGYTGLCLDLYHFRGEGAVNLLPWQETLPKLLPHTTEIHVSAGRVDMPTDTIDTNAELKDLLDGTNKTELPQILQTIKDVGWNGYVVTEIPAAAIHFLDRHGRFIPPSTLEGRHRAITSTIKGILS